MTAWIAIAVGVVTLVSLVIGFVAVLARASNATATIESLRGRITDKDGEIADLRQDLAEEKAARQKLQGQVDVLTERVTQRAAVDDLTRQVNGHHRDVTSALRTLHEDLEKVQGLLQPEGKR